jgi:hypothetical protein
MCDKWCNNVTKKVMGDHVESDDEDNCIFIDEIRDTYSQELRSKLISKDNQCKEILIKHGTDM